VKLPKKKNYRYSTLQTLRDKISEFGNYNEVDEENLRNVEKRNSANLSLGTCKSYIGKFKEEILTFNG
jgi:hypothetical protein